jgi:hypothetical protein
VQLAYLDESEAPTAYYITALVVSDKDSIALATALDEVVEWAQANFGGVHSRAELHAHDLVGGQKDWEQYRNNIPARIAVYERAIDAITSFDVRAYIRGADRDSHNRRYGVGTDIHGTVLPWVLERVQGDAKRRDDLVLAIADELQQHDRYRRAMREYQQTGTWGWKPEVLDRIADTLHFAPSHSSRLLQAADLVSYAHTQMCRDHKDQRTQNVWARVWGKLGAGVIKEASCWRW